MIHAYKQSGLNIVLDVVSGSIHVVDDAAYDAILIYENAGKNETLSRVAKEHPELEAGEIAELVSDIGELERRGKLFSVDQYSEKAETSRKMPIKALCMNVSHMCNMSCSYCFAGHGEYGGGGLMPFDTGKRAIDFLIENSGNRKNLDVDFFGGEPLLNWDVVKDIVRYAREVGQTAGKNFRFTLTTNGLLIDDDVISFTNKEMRNVVLSLDGRPEVNDAARKLAGGGGSYSEVVPKIMKLIAERGGKDYYIRGTFTRGNLDFVNDVTHMADLGFTELSLEPVVTKPGSEQGLTMDDLPHLCEQYERLAEEMYQRESEGRGFKFYHFKLDFLGGPCVYKRVAGCGVGTQYLAVTPRGELFPCHQFVGDDSFLLGDVWRGVTNRKLLGEFRGNDIYKRPECVSCWARMYCGGGCAANAYNDSGDIKGIYRLGCELFKKRVECAIALQLKSRSLI